VAPKALVDSIAVSVIDQKLPQAPKGSPPDLTILNTVTAQRKLAHHSTINQGACEAGASFSCGACSCMVATMSESESK